MRHWLKKAETAINIISTISGAISALSIVAAAVIITEGVVVRKILGVSTIWQIEASVMLLIFAVFMGAPFVQKNEHHLNVDLIIIHLKPRTREIVLIIVSVITCLLVLLLAVYAWPMWWEALVENSHSESLWGPPLWIPYLFLPFGMSLLFLQYLVHILKKIINLKEEELAKTVQRFEVRDIVIPDRKETS